MTQRKLLWPLALFASFLLFSPLSHGQDIGLFIEPGLSYELGESETDYPLFDNSTGEVKGFGVVGRLGMHFNESFFLALDARYSMPRFTDSAVDIDTEATAYQYGPLVGMQMPDWGMRFWTGYVLGGQLDPKEDNNVDVRLEDPQGFQLGAGLHWEMLSINIEYQSLVYGQTVIEDAGGLSFGDVDSIEFSNDSWIASVTFPFEL